MSDVKCLYCASTRDEIKRDAEIWEIKDPICCGEGVDTGKAIYNQTVPGEAYVRLATENHELKQQLRGASAQTIIRTRWFLVSIEHFEDTVHFCFRRVRR